MEYRTDREPDLDVAADTGGIGVLNEPSDDIERRPTPGSAGDVRRGDLIVEGPGAVQMIASEVRLVEIQRRHNEPHALLHQPRAKLERDQAALDRAPAREQQEDAIGVLVATAPVTGRSGFQRPR